MYYLCSENGVADQLLRSGPLFSHMQKSGFSHDAAHIVQHS